MWPAINYNFAKFDNHIYAVDFVIYRMVYIFCAISELCISIHTAQSTSKFLILELFMGFTNFVSQYN